MHTHSSSWPFILLPVGIWIWVIIRLFRDGSHLATGHQVFLVTVAVLMSLLIVSLCLSRKNRA